MLKSSLIILSVLFSLNILAQSLGTPSLAGTGCIDNQISATLSEDKSKIILMLEPYTAVVLPNSGKTLDRQNCAIAIPVQIPNGMKLSILKSKIRGTVSLKSVKSSAQVNVEAFLAGTRSQPLSLKLTKTRSKTYVAGSPILEQPPTTACGQDTIIRINSSLLVKNESSIHPAKVSLGSHSGLSGIVVYIDLERCI